MNQVVSDEPRVLSLTQTSTDLSSQAVWDDYSSVFLGKFVIYSFWKNAVSLDSTATLVG